MNEISFEEFANRNGNTMAAVSADERQFYDLGDETLGLVARYEEDGETRFGASTLTPTTFYNGEYRVSDSRYETGKTEDGRERARTKVFEWLENQQ